MTRDDIIRMGQRAGAFFDPYHAVFILTEHRFEKFAALVAAAEREACAEVAESYEPRCDVCPKGVANAIRARGET